MLVTDPIAVVVQIVLDELLDDELLEKLAPNLGSNRTLEARELRVVLYRLAETLLEQSRDDFFAIDFGRIAGADEVGGDSEKHER